MTEIKGKFREILNQALGNGIYLNKENNKRNKSNYLVSSNSPSTSNISYLSSRKINRKDTNNKYFMSSENKKEQSDSFFNYISTRENDETKNSQTNFITSPSLKSKRFIFDQNTNMTTNYPEHKNMASTFTGLSLNIKLKNYKQKNNLNNYENHLDYENKKRDQTVNTEPKQFFKTTLIDQEPSFNKNFNKVRRELDLISKYLIPKFANPHGSINRPVINFENKPALDISSKIYLSQSPTNVIRKNYLVTTTQFYNRAEQKEPVTLQSLQIKSNSQKLQSEEDDVNAYLSEFYLDKNKTQTFFEKYSPEKRRVKSDKQNYK